MDFMIKTFGILYLIVSSRIKASKQKDPNTQNDHLWPYWSQSVTAAKISLVYMV